MLIHTYTYTQTNIHTFIRFCSGPKRKSSVKRRRQKVVSKNKSKPLCKFIENGERVSKLNYVTRHTFTKTTPL